MEPRELRAGRRADGVRRRTATSPRSTACRCAPRRARSSRWSGPSGCGKSTLLELVCGLRGARRAATVTAPPAALMPQRDGLLPWLSALDNAGAGAARRAARRAREARAAAHEHFAAFGLEGFERARPRGALRRDAPARRVPAHAAGRAAGAVPRRAVRRARRADARADAALAGRRAGARAAHGAAGDPRRRGGGPARRPDRAALAAARAGWSRRSRSTLPRPRAAHRPRRRRAARARAGARCGEGGA